MINLTLKLCYAVFTKRSPVLTASVIVLVLEKLLLFSARPVGERTAISPLCIPFSERLVEPDRVLTRLDRLASRYRLERVESEPF